MSGPGCALLCVLALTVWSVDASRWRRSADMQMVATPEDVVADETELLTVSCSPPEAVLADVFQPFLISMDYEHNGTVTYLARQTELTHLVVDDSDNMTSADGAMEDKNVFLTVTIGNPSPDHEGVYHCKFMFLDNKFQVQQIEASVNVNVTVIVVEPNVTEAVVVIVPEPTTPAPPAPVGCVCNTDRIWMELDNIKTSLAADNAALRAQMTSYDDSCRVSFAAGFKKRFGNRLLSDSLMIFDNVLSNRGGAYNNGVFVAPCSGQYYFSLTLRTTTRDSGYVEGHIQANGNTMVKTSVLTDHHSQNSQSASADVVLTLTKGEKVKVHLMTTSMGEVAGQDYSVFNGFFLHP